MSASAVVAGEGIHSPHRREQSAGGYPSLVGPLLFQEAVFEDAP